MFTVLSHSAVAVLVLEVRWFECLLELLEFLCLRFAFFFASLSLRSILFSLCSSCLSRKLRSFRYPILVLSNITHSHSSRLAHSLTHSLFTRPSILIYPFQSFTARRRPQFTFSPVLHPSLTSTITSTIASTHHPSISTPSPFCSRSLISFTLPCPVVQYFLLVRSARLCIDMRIP